MPVPVGRRFTANLSESRPKAVNCEKCQTEFVYFMKRSASGSGSSLLFLDNQGANRTISKQKFDELVLAAQPKAEKHWPIVGATRVVRKHAVGAYRAHLEDNIESIG